LQNERINLAGGDIIAASSSRHHPGHAHRADPAGGTQHPHLHPRLGDGHRVQVFIPSSETRKLL